MNAALSVIGSIEVEVGMKLNKMNVARRQLEVAIELFLADGDLISIITLAGAAEEIFGKIALKADKENSLGFMLRTHKTLGSTATEKELIKHANLVRNALKHANDEDDEESSLTNGALPLKLCF